MQHFREIPWVHILNYDAFYVHHNEVQAGDGQLR